MYVRIIRQNALGFGRQLFHVLAVFENRYPFPVLMRSDAGQALQHFITFYEEAAVTDVVIRKNRAPDRMCMKDGAGAGAFDDCNVEQRFSRRLSVGWFQHISIAVDFENMFRQQPALVQRARRNCEAKGIALNDGAEISTRPESPATPVKITAEFGEMLRVIHGREL